MAEAIETQPVLGRSDDNLPLVARAADGGLAVSGQGGSLGERASLQAHDGDRVGRRWARSSSGGPRRTIERDAALFGIDDGEALLALLG